MARPSPTPTARTGARAGSVGLGLGLVVVLLVLSQVLGDQGLHVHWGEVVALAVRHEVVVAHDELLEVQLPALVAVGLRKHLPAISRTSHKANHLALGLTKRRRVQYKKDAVCASNEQG